MLNWLSLLYSLDKRRQLALDKAVPGVMRDYLSAPFVDKRVRLDQAPIIALDMETTGLNAKSDRILSIGAVEINQQRIPLGTAWYRVIKLQQQLPGESVVVHQITDDQMQQGESLDKVLPDLLQRLQGKVMLVHYKRVEHTFLQAACMRLYGAPFLIPTIDTLALAQRILERRNHTLQSNALRLFNLRDYYHLPRYKAHNALTDALATAELFLALAEEIAPNGNAKIGDFIQG